MSLKRALLPLAFLLLISLAYGQVEEITVEDMVLDSDGLPKPFDLRVPLKYEKFRASLNLASKDPNGNYGNYTEKHSYSEFMIKKKIGGGFEYNGAFYHRSKYHRLFPTPESLVLGPHTSKQEFVLDGVPYTVTLTAFSKWPGDSSLHDVEASHDHFNLTVELMLHVDYSIYLKWLEFYNSSAQEALVAIKNYYSYVMNEVNGDYQRIKRSDFSISTHLSRLYVDTTKSIYTDKLVTSKRVKVSGNDALATAMKWLDGSEHHKKYDAVIFLGNLDLDNLAGIARAWEICREHPITVVTHTGQNELITAISHELAHILGAMHDGSRMNDCHSNTENIMSTYLIDANKPSNTKFFSSCSIGYFKMTLNVLNRHKNCLLNQPKTPQDLHHDDLLVGQHFSVDEQCRLLYGPESFYCGGRNLCGKMGCYRPLEKDCKSIGRQMAADGTQCGDKKWCMTGACVEDQRAPSAESDTCVYGDQKDKFDEWFAITSCEEVATTHPEYCYHDVVQSRCCQTCPKFYKPEAKGCEYGDKFGLCKGVISLPSHCRLRNVAKECCESCKLHYKGDDIGSYDPYEATGECTDDWVCSANSPFRCYIEEHREKCCFTCQTIANKERKGCVYGDRLRDCSGRECSKECCSKCDDDQLKALNIE